LNSEEGIRHEGPLVTDPIHVYRHNKGPALGDQERTLLREMPFKAEIAFSPFLGVRRNDRHKQGAFLNLLADALVPSVTAPKLTLVEPDLDPGSAKGLTDAPSGFSIL